MKKNRSIFTDCARRLAGCDVLLPTHAHLFSVKEKKTIDK